MNNSAWWEVEEQFVREGFGLLWLVRQDKDGLGCVVRIGPRRCVLKYLFILSSEYWPGTPPT